MAELKEEIRNLLREELSLMKDEFKLRQTAVEQVAIRSNDDLMAFVHNILGRARMLISCDKLKRGPCVSNFLNS